MSKSIPKTPASVAVWILFCAFFNCAGWLLSVLHQLNAAGYTVTFILGITAIILLRQRLFTGDFPRWNWRKLRRRFGRTFPLAFLILAFLAMLGGALYAPSNYDAMAYRVPRTLHWLAERRWHWIHTDFARLNTRACGFEWLAAPIIALTRTDRLLFLLNTVSFLLLPGLVFSVLTRLGVRARAAWHWMWLLPTGYSYLLQAGSLGNDLFGAVFPLAALDFALRARTSQKARDLWFSVLAAALMTSAKSSNLPLLLPWLVALAPSLRLLRKKIPATAAIGAVAALASFLPTAALNWKYSGDWTGLAVEKTVLGTGERGESASRLGYNCIVLLAENLAPPVFPWADSWNAAVLNIIPPAWNQRLEKIFEPSQAHLVLGELEVEESAGLGFGVTTLLLAGLAAIRSGCAPGQTYSERNKLFRRSIIACAWVSLAVFLAKSGWATAARLVTPYYALTIPLLLVGDAQARLVRSRWWKRGALLVFLLAALVLVLSPPRPLWPAKLCLAKLERQWPASRLVSRAKVVYSVYAQRADGFAPVRSFLPAGTAVLGCVTFDDPETSLWRPFGSRRIEHVLKTDSPADLRRRGIAWVLVGSERFSMLFDRPLEQWLAENGGEVVRVIPLRLRAGQGSVDWLLVKLRREETKKS